VHGESFQCRKRSHKINSMSNIDKLKSKVADLPQAPGVYIFKDSRGKIIYIGKAKSLKKRAQTYFSRRLDTKTQAMVSRIADMEYRITPSEIQAQLLEACLIKDNQPQYNIDLKDDKSFPWIRINDEEFPLISILRRKKLQEDGRSLYFGPYTNAKLLRQAFKAMRRIFGFRSCKKMPKQACLYSRLKLCPAPCIGKISSRDYREVIQRIKLFLESKHEELLQELAGEMREAAAMKNFEQAAKLRDQINALSAIGRVKPGFTSIDELEDLKNLLKLDRLPERIEAFDISNISGREACGSMVSFYKGIPDKNNYRRFRINTVGAINDYAMLKEVIRRRYSRLINENLTLPDVVLIDGGKGQLGIAEEEMNALKIKVAVVSIAKAREEIYAPGRKRAIRLKPDSPALQIIQRVRDEAHRFAVAYHHILRRKKIIGK